VRTSLTKLVLEEIDLIILKEIYSRSQNLYITVVHINERQSNNVFVCNSKKYIFHLELLALKLQQCFAQKTKRKKLQWYRGDTQVCWSLEFRKLQQQCYWWWNSNRLDFKHVLCLINSFFKFIFYSLSQSPSSTYLISTLYLKLKYKLEHLRFLFSRWKK